MLTAGCHTQLAMFSPVTPILSAGTSDEAAALVLVRVQAIQTVLSALARMAGDAAGPDLQGLGQRAELAAAITDLDPTRLAHVANELDATAAALQAGFLAIEKARSQGHSAQAAALLLHAETRDAFGVTLATARVRPVAM